MTDDQEGPSLDREAANHYRLGNLLRKDRSELKARMVQSVINESGSLEEKISKINAIDLKPEAEIDPRSVPHRRPVHHLGRVLPLKPPGAAREAKAASPAKARDAAPKPSGGTPLGQEAAAIPPDPQVPARRDSRLALSGSERRQIKARFSGELRPADPALQQVSRNRLRNLVEPEHGGILNYLFGEYRRIRQFGLATRTLEAGSWPFSLRVSAAVPVFLEKTLKQGQLQSLSEALGLILKKGWLFLDRGEYNLLALLPPLVAQVRRVECRQAGGGVELSLPALNAVLSGILVFQSEPGLAERLHGLFAKAAERVGLDEESRVQGLVAIRSLVDAGADGLTLPNLVRALWMKRSHRYLGILDLGSKAPLARYVTTAAFDCSPEVQAEIDRHLAQLVTRLDVIDLERIELDRWRAYLPAAPARSAEQAEAALAAGEFKPALVDWGRLREFYAWTATGERHDLEADRLVPLLQVARFLDKFRLAFEPLLVSGIRVAGNARVEILQRILFAPQFSKLEFLHARIQEMLVAMPHLGQTRFRELTGGLGGTDAENLMASRIQELAAVLTNLGKALADIIKNRSDLADLVFRGGQFEPPAYPLPSEGDAIAQPGFLCGKTVLAALCDAVSLSLLQGMLLVPGEMELMLAREKELRAQLAPVREGLDRLASDEQLTALREAYSPLLGGPEGGGPA